MPDLKRTLATGATAAALSLAFAAAPVSAQGVDDCTASPAAKTCVDDVSETVQWLFLWDPDLAGEVRQTVDEVLGMNDETLCDAQYTLLGRCDV